PGKIFAESGGSYQIQDSQGLIFSVRKELVARISKEASVSDMAANASLSATAHVENRHVFTNEDLGLKATPASAPADHERPTQPVSLRTAENDFNRLSAACRAAGAELPNRKFISTEVYMVDGKPVRV